MRLWAASPVLPTAPMSVTDFQNLPTASEVSSSNIPLKIHPVSADVIPSRQDGIDALKSVQKDEIAHGLLGSGMISTLDQERLLLYNPSVQISH